MVAARRPGFRTRFPYADLTVGNRGIGGYSPEYLIRTLPHYDFYPDLIIFHDFGGEDKYEQIIAAICENTTPEILIQSGYPSCVPTPNEPENQTKAEREAFHEKHSYQWLPALCEKHYCEVVDVRIPWIDYLKKKQLKASALLADGVHLNARENESLANIAKRYLRYHPALTSTAASVQTIAAPKWNKGRLKITVKGNRVEAVAERGGAYHQDAARVLIDRRAPSSIPELYLITRPTDTFAVEWPAVTRVSAEEPLLVEDWTLKVQETNADDSQRRFSVTDSKTGPDSNGVSTDRFVSKSGRVIIEAGDYGVSRAFTLKHQLTLIGFEVKWSVIPMFPDIYNAPRISDPSSVPLSISRFSFAVVIAIAAIAALLRLPWLDVRPMHADEAVLADKFGQLLAKGRFQYDSADYHGPVLEYLTLLPAAAKGEWTYASLDEWTLRLVPALAGIALALSPMLLRKFIGNSAASAAGLLIATSTPLVYYSRDYIPEMLLALFTAIFVALFLHSRWISAGLVAGLAAATKETAVLAIGASLIAFCWERWPGWKPLILFTVTAAIITVAILGPANILPATHAYLLRAAGAEWHIHAWSYYLQLISFGTPFILVFAAIGAPAHRRFAVFTVLLIAVYSVIPYKTPWCVVTMVWALSIMAGLGFRELSLQMFFVATAAIVLVCIVSSWQAWNASTARAADPSNRWVYAQTTPDVYEIVVQIGQFAPDRNDRISVYSTQNLWPLPWYLRQYSNVQWSRDVDSRANPAAIVIVTPELEGKLATRLYTARLPGQRELYVPILPGTTLLRPGVEVRVYVAKSLYDQRAR